MSPNPIADKTIVWTFSDGPMAQRRFRHHFDKQGTVTFQAFDRDEPGKVSQPVKYEVATLGQNVCVVSYLGPNGFTLTTVLELKSGTLVAFASNEKSLTLQHGTFEVAKLAA